ncbi:MAG: PSD1 domain-containing protein [Planctomycetales bacterium]|nr:PSD1 domain-containing protein [Planctomycetales bacterium]
MLRASQSDLHSNRGEFAFANQNRPPRIPLRFAWGVTLALSGWSWCTSATADQAASAEPSPTASSSASVDFSRDIRPLLSDRCFLCHGPDEEDREADLRFDDRTDAVREREGTFVIKPGDPQASTIFERLTSNDEDLRMPPPDSGKAQFTAEEIELLKRWIAAGAHWSGHWAFTAPVRPEVPQVADESSLRNPIDAFVLSHLQDIGLTQSTEAAKVVLLRRLYLDLLGLPPTIQQIDDFLSDTSDDAYEKLVDQLLASPHYGERWGRIWLDAARYADSDGFEKDKAREVWFYRDWVINALNNDMPYDQFVIEQLAGDLIPDATQDQIVATGFLRNSMTNEEGGIDPEQFRMEAMFDRMDALGKSILGFTMQCAQCHSHKYDPMGQDDYYQMFAFLNNCHERTMTVYTPEQESQRQAILQQIDQLETELREANPDWQTRMAEWEAGLTPQTEWHVLALKNLGDNGQRYYHLDDGSTLAQGYSPINTVTIYESKTDLPEIRSLQLEMLTDLELPASGPGRGWRGMFALTEFKAEVASVDNPGAKTPVKFVRATADYSNDSRELPKRYAKDDGKPGTSGPVAYAIDGDKQTSWGIDAGPGRRNQPRKAVFVADKNIAFAAGTVLTLHLDQSSGGVNGNADQSLNLGRYRISISSADADADPVPAAVREIFKIAPVQRTAEQQLRVFSYWRTTVAEWQPANDRIEALWNSHPEGATQLVLKERAVPRVTHRLERGNFLDPQEEVSPGIPEFLHDWPAESPKSRLSFARWLVDRRSPTAARAIVNRVWQAYFGVGLVSTSEDFGSQGEVPIYPQLLDWLAVELMDHHWSLKHLHRQIVHSATYRQSSQVSPALQARDPDNRLLARGPRFRVDAEVVRDIFLAASGLLTPTVGGPSVYPPAPSFLFLPPASYGTKEWEVDTGPNRYRRALYTFRYRSVPYPALQTFDAPSGEFASVRRTRSNTPLQALTTLNEPLFMECSQSLALQTIQNGGTTDPERAAYAFRRCVARAPQEAEQSLLVDLLRHQLEKYRQTAADPWAILANEAGERPQLAEDIDPASLAAWTVVSRVLLNMDETITKE